MEITQTFWHPLPDSIEGGLTAGYPAFIAELRSLFAADTRKQYYITAAPQCPFPGTFPEYILLNVCLQINIYRMFTTLRHSPSE